MKKYIKYLISILLIFGLTVNECSIYSQTNAANYHQVSYLNAGKDLHQTHSELKVYTKTVLSKKVKLATVSTYSNLQDIYSAQIQIILKFQTQLYQKINSIKCLHIFLSKTITSSNHYSNLYIA